MIHEEYMPVYMGSRFLARDGTGRDGTGRTEVVQEALADLKREGELFEVSFLNPPCPAPQLPVGGLQIINLG